jgi:PleD family two-component response regulator
LVLLDLNLYEPARETMRGPLASSRGEARRTAQGTEIFRKAKSAAPQVPVILLVDPQDITLAEFLLREGAQDFLLKSQIDCAPLAHAIRNAIERHRYLESARAAGMTDPLTGLLNRSAFLTLAERDRQLALATHRRILLAIGEPSREEQSEPEGAPVASSSGPAQNGRVQECDLALIRIAEQLRAAAGPTDLIARIGEDQFGVVVCETDPLSWDAAWARLQTTSAAAHVTIGAAEFDPERPVTLEALLEQAERELAPVAVAARR